MWLNVGGTDLCFGFNGFGLAPDGTFWHILAHSGGKAWRRVEDTGGEDSVSFEERGDGWDC
jgi:hypothetical protein